MEQNNEEVCIEHNNCCHLCAINIDSCKDHIDEHIDKEKEQREERDIWFFEMEARLERSLENVEELQKILAASMDNIIKKLEGKSENIEQTEEKEQTEEDKKEEEVTKVEDMDRQ